MTGSVPAAPVATIEFHRGRSLRSRVVSGVLDRLMTRALRDWTGSTLDPELRDRLAAFDRLAAHLPLPHGTRVGTVSVNGLRAEWVVGRGVRDLDAVLMYLHGGGWVFGGLNSHRALASRLSSAAGRPVLLLDYRMVPDVSLDEEVEDCLAGFRWLVERGVAPARIAIAGDSAGGHLALATALRARDRGLPVPGAVVGLSGVYDMTPSARAGLGPQDDPTGSAVALEWLIETVLAGDEPQRFSPLHGDLAGLPPVLLVVGSDEVVRQDAERLARRLASARAECLLQVWDGQPHVFQAFAPLLPEARRSITEIGRFLRRQFDLSHDVHPPSRDVADRRP
ncbi:alpha/beta hydrolase [Pseudonocardia spirodelae]|uniref:Alpha/beta hydrolase n=1 Tax=Pseudonocardia spirodelae TaxID=3133431 RepID=A0ABU8T2K7_9PSEU